MRKLLVANWKMNFLKEESISFAKKIKKELCKDCEIVLAPSFPYLSAVANIIQGTKIKLAAQDVAQWAHGSYTGEVSAKMLKELGCDYVIIGHSERRQYLDESSQDVSEKVIEALKQKITPILCIGESFEDKKTGTRETVLIQQLKNDLRDIDLFTKKKIVIAYEPIWAVGTGQVVTREDLEEVYAILNRALNMMCGGSYLEEKVSFIYGGSITHNNIDNFDELSYVKGFLVGKASLDFGEFIKIAKS